MEAETVESNHNEQGHFNATAPVALLAGLCSALLGLVSFVTNSVLLLTLFKDPYNYFRARPTTFFVASLSLSDFLGGAFVQPLYATYMLCLPCGVKIPNLFKISTIFSDTCTKISIFTVVALSVDRFLAIKLALRYRALITVRRVVICNILIWLSCGLFEVSHLTSIAKEILHSVDLHLQTTAPLALLCVVYTATYIEFRRYSRNVTILHHDIDGRRRLFVRNIRSEKRIVLTIILIIIVLFISLMPYLIVTNLGEQCLEEESNVCGELAFKVTRALSISLLCVSCAVNPFLYAWRIPQYRQAVKAVWRATFSRGRRRNWTACRSALASGNVIEQNTPAGYQIKPKNEWLKLPRPGYETLMR